MFKEEDGTREKVNERERERIQWTHKILIKTMMRLSVDAFVLLPVKLIHTTHADNELILVLVHSYSYYRGVERWRDIKCACRGKTLSLCRSMSSRLASKWHQSSSSKRFSLSLGLFIVWLYKWEENNRRAQFVIRFFFSPSLSLSHSPCAVVNFTFSTHISRSNVFHRRGSRRFLFISKCISADGAIDIQ